MSSITIFNKDHEYFPEYFSADSSRNKPSDSSKSSRLSTLFEGTVGGVTKIIRNARDVISNIGEAAAECFYPNLSFHSESYEELQSENNESPIESLLSSEQPEETVKVERTGWKKAAYKIAYFVVSCLSFGIIPLINWYSTKKNSKVEAKNQDAKPEAPMKNLYYVLPEGLKTERPDNFKPIMSLKIKVS